jgi:hypothetical protein
MLNTTFTSESFTGISMCSSFSVVDIPYLPSFDPDISHKVMFDSVTA